MDEWVSDNAPSPALAADGGDFPAPSLSPGDTSPSHETAEALPEAQAADMDQPDGTQETGREPDRDNGDEGQPASPFTVPVKYNKEYRELTPEEAGVYAQMGMKYQSLEPQLNKLRQLAAGSGRSFGQLVENLYTAGEEMARRECLEQAGGNAELAAQLLDYRNLKGGRAFEDAKAAEQKEREAERTETNGRLADEFLELSRECPEVKSIRDLPDAVLEAATRKNASLTAEYLLYKHREEQNLQRAERDVAAASKAAAGSMRDSAAPTGGPAFSAMLDGIWR